MTTSTPGADRGRDTQIVKWVARHRFIAFVGLTYGLSWSLWLVAARGGGQVPFLLGALGPMAAAAIVRSESAHHARARVAASSSLLASASFFAVFAVSAD